MTIKLISALAGAAGWRVQLERWLKSRPGMASIERNGTCYWLPAPEMREALEPVLAEPDRFIEGGKLLKRNADNKASVFSLPAGGRCFAKASWICRMKWTHQLRYLVAPSRGVWSAVAAARVEAAGVRTPRVWAVGERRRFGRTEASYLFTEAIEDAQSLRAWLSPKSCSRAEIHARVRRLGLALNRLLEAGVQHRDLTPNNIFIERSGDIGFWDLDSCALYDGPAPEDAALEAEAQLLASLLSLEQPAGASLSSSPAALAADLLDALAPSIASKDAVLTRFDFNGDEEDELAASPL